MKEFATDKIVVGDSGPTEAGSHDTQLIFRCPKLFQLEVVRQLRIPAQGTPSHFAIGSIVGAMRREWFAKKFDTGAKTWKHLIRAAQEEAEKARLPIQQKDEAYSHYIMQEYIAHWSVRAQPTVKAVEYKLGPSPLVKGDRFNLMRTAKPDDLSYYPEAGGALCLADLKTTSNDFGALVREYELHVQPLQYIALYKVDPMGEKRFGKVAGFLLDAVQKPSERRKKPAFQRIFIEYRDEAIDNFIQSVRAYLISANKIDWDADVPRTFQCTYMAGRARVDCTFKELCRFGKAAAQRYVLADGTPLKKYKPRPGAEKMPWE